MFLVLMARLPMSLIIVEWLSMCPCALANAASDVLRCNIELLCTHMIASPMGIGTCRASSAKSPYAHDIAQRPSARKNPRTAASTLAQ